MPTKGRVRVLQNIIDHSKRIVCFTGAGVSTASGIPDFRGGDGLFAEEPEDGLTPEMILSQSFFYLHPERFFDFYRSRMLYPAAEPNAAHRAIYALEAAGKLRGVVTQNIDGLHRRAGNRLVYEVHGSVWENYCMDCNAFYGLEKILGSEGIPRCERCGGVVKPWVVLYGEAPDKYTCMGACREISNCDTLIVAGTSLSVEPAASFLEYFHGKRLVVINREPTPADKRAELVIHGDVAQVLGGIHVESP
ncbi:MAG: NAD-dependent protein deacylase [Clostridia bacterium]|nr:NAD-dependent protein deacylase [Clostridia bacterium]MBQ3477743.1 NAD-dependent protein deacylase [Clostridia bacterium]MBQ6120233.1 NAD-dependent protein deacylase [Clostridia bacterium]